MKYLLFAFGFLGLVVSRLTFLLGLIFLAPFSTLDIFLTLRWSIRRLEIFCVHAEDTSHGDGKD